MVFNLQYLRMMQRMGPVACWLMTSAACSLTHLTVNQTAEVLSQGRIALYSEKDVEFAQDAIPASLKTIETFLAAHPEQRTLLELLAEGFTSYPFAFFESEIEIWQEEDPDRAEALRRRALGFYERARSYGLRLLALDYPDLAGRIRQKLRLTPAMLQQVDEDGVPGLFWVAAPWGSAIDVIKSPEYVAELPQVRMIIDRVIQLDETYYWGGPHMVVGMIESAVPKALGGKPEQARAAFQRAIDITQGRHLLLRVLLARRVGVQSGDRAYFEKELTDVLAADPDAEPALGLGNRVGQQRARRYLQQIDDMFL